MVSEFHEGVGIHWEAEHSVTDSYALNAWPSKDVSL